MNTSLKTHRVCLSPQLRDRAESRMAEVLAPVSPATEDVRTWLIDDGSDCQLGMECRVVAYLKDGRRVVATAFEYDPIDAVDRALARCRAQISRALERERLRGAARPARPAWTERPARWRRSPEVALA